MKYILQLFTFVMCVLTANAQGNWKGFDMTRTTNVFDKEAPVGTICMIVETYGSSKRFGKAPSEDGALKSTDEYHFDENGYCINDGEKTYINHYNENGLIQEREIKKDGKQTERWAYEYIYDEKGPGVIIKKYNEDGEGIGIEGWQDNSYYSQAPGGEALYKLNKEGRLIDGTIAVTNYRQQVEFKQTATYNDHGYLESTTMTGPDGRSKVILYSDYIYDEGNRWIQRYSDGNLTKRRFLNQEEYNSLIEQRRIAEERKRRQEIADKVAMEKEIFSNGRFPKSEDLYSKPTAEISINEVDLDNLPYITFEFVVEPPSNVINYKELFSLDIKQHGQFKFANDSIGAVPTYISGEIFSKKIGQKRFDSGIKLQISYDKKSKVWVLKNSDKLISKYHLSSQEIDALTERLPDIVEKYGEKNVYLKGLYQLQVTVESDEESYFKINQTQTFPIRFLIYKKG